MKRLILLAMTAVACGTGSNGEVGTDTATIGCLTDSRAVDVAAGLRVSSTDGAVTVVVDEASPSPPARGDNSWTVRLLDGAGQALDSPEVAVSPFMPEHGHGSPTQAVAEQLSDGRWKLSPVDLFMPGLWEVRIDVTPTGAARTRLTIAVCIQG